MDSTRDLSRIDFGTPNAGLNPTVEVGALLLATMSGCAALIYQVSWFQTLSLVLGASALSLGMLLATFMGGLGLGSLLATRWRDARFGALSVFALLELGIGSLSFVVDWTIPALGGIYTEWADSSLAGVVLRLGLCALSLLPSCILMGATLPALARAVALDTRGVAWLGRCYAANTLGAAIGSVLAAFYLLRFYDARTATATAAAINFAAAMGAFALLRSRSAKARSTAARPPLGLAGNAERVWRIYLVAAGSGFTALTAEVIWTRQLALLLGGTVYTLAMVLCVFLLGIAFGGAAGGALSVRARATQALAACQWLLCAAMAWAAHTLAHTLPYWPIDVTIPTTSVASFELDFVRVAWTTLPAALLWGASLPLAIAAAAPASRDARQVLGRVYAANTAGAIFGALATSFWLIPAIGSQRTVQLSMLIAAAAGFLSFSAQSRRLRAALRSSIYAVVSGLVILLAAVLPALPPELVAYGRFLPTRGLDANVVYVGEGLTASIAVSQEPSGILTYHNAGKTQASTYPQDLRLQRMLGHLATLLSLHPQSVLVIGLGAGITAGAVSLDPEVERVVVAEIEPLAEEVARRYFNAANFAVIENAKVELHHDDGRHYLATTHTTFDAITSDPLDPWVKGAAALYTREFWQLVSSRLNDGGVVTVFLQLYESDQAAVQSELATFFDVFPDGAVFANTVAGIGYDAVLVGRKNASPIDVSSLARKLDRRAYAPLAASLREVGFSSAIDLLATFAVQGRDLTQWLEGAALNTDGNLRLQYLAGQALNVNRAPALFDSLLGDGPHFPADLFTGTPAEIETLRQRLAARRGP